ncbi:MAG TPA: IclR family transcriptional regulator [Terriglobia bacterium]|nr:IclR family transcriptional regulator [Terriglobia bacterium]
MKNLSDRPKPATAYTVKSLVKALNILEVLADEEPPYTLTRLSHRLHLHVSTVHRLLVNLVRHGFVEEDPVAGGYQLSYRILRMGLGVMDRLDFRRVALPLLRELNLRTQETVHLAILQGSGTIFIEKFDSPQPVGLDARLGRVMPLHCTGVGKTLLAYQGEELLHQIAESPGLTRLTGHTLTTLPHLRKELERIREQGYAVDHEEAVEGLRCVAGPIFNHLGQIAAAFSVAGPAMRLTSARISEMAPLVRETSQQISYRLGRRAESRPPEGPADGTHAERGAKRGSAG